MTRDKPNDSQATYLKGFRQSAKACVMAKVQVHDTPCELPLLSGGSFLFVVK